MKKEKSVILRQYNENGTKVYEKVVKYIDRKKNEDLDFKFR